MAHGFYYALLSEKTNSRGSSLVQSMGFTDLTMPRTQRNAIPQSPAQRKGRVSLLPQSPALSKKELTVSFKPMPQSPASGHSCRFQLCPAVRYIVSRPKFVRKNVASKLK